MMVRIIGVTVLAMALAVSSAFAATQSTAPLPAGHPSGVKVATLTGLGTTALLLGLGTLAIGLALTLSNDNKNTVTGPTTSSTNTHALP